ncbi:tol-pal system-associated acyl-CoA thioesterase [Aquabacterium sp.]|uniref:tol-pal system-associated acyl-CoA thioesterase n=1 Tax=Aquabacterium sp. TaxID=1872578 RepID=UPI0035B12DA4
MTTSFDSTAPRPDFVFPVRVYWEDTDGQGVVFYANYIKFFERARTEWLRVLGFGQMQLKRDAGGLFVVGETTARYLRPAKLDDLLSVTVRVLQQGRSSLTFEQQVWRGDTLLTEGEIRIGWVEPDPLTGDFRPRRIPAVVLARLQTAASAAAPDSSSSLMASA